jgi:transcriptional regulator of met regulon
METHNIDSIIKKVIDESVNYYAPEADLAKERIWKKVQFQKRGNISLVLLRLLVAACILLFLSTSVISISYFRTKKSIKTLAQLNCTLINNAKAHDKIALEMNESVYTPYFKSNDTIYIEKKVTVSKPVIITKQVTDTVYVRQIVYVKNEQTPELLTKNENSFYSDYNIQNSPALYETKILISNNESNKQERRKKIQIRFGGHNEQPGDGTLAFTTKF